MVVWIGDTGYLLILTAFSIGTCHGEAKVLTSSLICRMSPEVDAVVL